MDPAARRFGRLSDLQHSGQSKVEPYTGISYDYGDAHPNTDTTPGFSLHRRFVETGELY